MKKIKKLFVFTLMFSLALPALAAETSTSTAVVITAPVITASSTSTSTPVTDPIVPIYSTVSSTATSSVDTSAVKDITGGQNPIVKVKWEMNATKSDNAYLGTDDAKTTGAQFMPSGKYQVNKNYAVCAVVTDPEGLADVNAVYADIFYPENISTGCGTKAAGISLKKLSKTDGFNLLCNNIRNNNNNLPTWNSVYNYDEVCSVDGELQKETAAVYCGESALAYNNPSGDYKVVVTAQDNLGLSGTLENTFTYMDLTAFETDFSAVGYGDVKLNTQKIASGDTTFGGNLASVRNVGNTRANIHVMQDDMGLGLTDTKWNVRYTARVGSDAAFKSYGPNTWVNLNNPLNLGETDEMDFSVTIFRFPTTGTNFKGNLTLAASKAPHLTCTNPL